MHTVLQKVGQRRQVLQHRLLHAAPRLQMAKPLPKNKWAACLQSVGPQQKPGPPGSPSVLVFCAHGRDVADECNYACQRDASGCDHQEQSPDAWIVCVARWLICEGVLQSVLRCSQSVFFTEALVEFQHANCMIVRIWEVKRVAWHAKAKTFTEADASVAPTITTPL